MTLRTAILSRLEAMPRHLYRGEGREAMIDLAFVKHILLNYEPLDGIYSRTRLNEIYNDLRSDFLAQYPEDEATEQAPPKPRRRGIKRTW